MKIEIKEDEKGKQVFCIGNLKFYNLAEAEKKLHELKELKKEKAKKKKAETNNETNEETKNNGRKH